MDRRHFLRAVGVAAGALALPRAARAAHKFKLSTEGSDTHQTTIWAKAFADAVAKRSNGQISVDVFTNAQLGNNKELLEAIGMGSGTVEIVATGTQDLVGWVPETQVFDLPFAQSGAFVDLGRVLSLGCNSAQLHMRTT